MNHSVWRLGYHGTKSRKEQEEPRTPSNHGRVSLNVVPGPPLSGCPRDLQTVGFLIPPRTPLKSDSKSETRDMWGKYQRGNSHGAPARAEPWNCVIAANKLMLMMANWLIESSPLSDLQLQEEVLKS